MQLVQGLKAYPVYIPLMNATQPSRAKGILASANANPDVNCNSSPRPPCKFSFPHMHYVYKNSLQNFEFGRQSRRPCVYTFIIHELEASASVWDGGKMLIFESNETAALLLATRSVILGISSGMRNGFETTSSCSNISPTFPSQKK